MTQLSRNNVNAQYNKLRSAQQSIDLIRYHAYNDIAKYQYRCDEYDTAEDIIDNLAEAQRHIEAAMESLREIIGDFNA